MGQCCCKSSSKNPPKDDDEITRFSSCSDDEFWDARSEASFMSAVSFLSVNTVVPSPQSAEASKKDAFEYLEEAKILKAKGALEKVADEEFWEGQGDKEISAIFAKAKQVEHAIHDLHIDEGYTVCREKPMKVLYRHEEGGTSHSIKIKAILEHEVKKVVSIPYEWDLLPYWNKYAMDAIKFNGSRAREAIVYGASWMIPPFKDFQAIMKASGFDVSEEYGSLVITIDDCESLAPTLALPKKASERRIVNFLDGSYIVLKPVVQNGHECTDAVLSVHLDPHIRGIPSSMVNFVLHIFTPYLFKQMERALGELFEDGSVFSERIDACPEVYQLIDTAVGKILVH